MAIVRHLTAPLPSTLLKAECDGRALTVTAALSVEVLDRAGDVVVTRGVDLRVHKADPWAGYEHYRRRGNEWVIPGPGEEDLPPVRVGTAAHADGRYGVELKAMPGHGDVLFATTRFDQRDPLSLQTYRLVEDGTLDGTSVEISLVKGFNRPLAPSPLGGRYGMHIDRCILLGYAHCAIPVNQAALVCKSLAAATAAAAGRRISLAQTGRLGSEPLHPLLLESFARDLPGKSTTVTSGFARVEKAMADSPEMEPAYEPEDAAPEAASAGGSTPTVQALYQLAQGLQDMKGQVEEMLAGSEHVKGKKFATKLLADLDATVEDATEMAAKIEAELGQTAEPADDAEPKPDVKEDDTEPDDDGVLKCIARRPAVFKAIRRFSLAEVRKAAPVAPPEPTPEPVDPELADLLYMQQNQPKKYARIVRECSDYVALNR
jgi:hypothetical protein